MPTLVDLLAKGYFPKELPPAFTTTSFANIATTGSGGIAREISASAQHHAEMCIHNMVRSGGLRRHLGLPNPVHHARLCDFVVQNWNRLQQKANLSPFSLTKPVDTDPKRAITGFHDLSLTTMKRVELRTRSRYILRADINRFYPSIYTHTLPWAIEGKSIVKAAKAVRKLGSIWSNQLDTLVRNQNDQQTMGIPIGPDTSLLLAEIILAAVDVELEQEIHGLRGIRFIDDYEFAVNQRSDAERVVSELQSILSQYELALNPGKTRIIELPDAYEPQWTTQLRTHLFRDAGVSGQKHDLTGYFDKVFVFARAEPDENIMKYAIARLSSVDVAEENWSLLQNILSLCALTEPACLPQVCDQVVHYKSQDRPIDDSLWTDCLNQVVIERLPLGQASEALWALWLLKQLNLHMSALAEKAVDNCDDSAVALMALGMASVGLANSAMFTRLHHFAESHELHGRQWLLCYEGNRQGWIVPPSKTSVLGTDAAFDFMSNNGVSFFNINAAAPQPRRLTAPVGSTAGYLI